MAEFSRVQRLIQNPRGAVRMVWRRAFLRPLKLTALSHYPIGTNIYSGQFPDWDLLILLDSCRVDALSEVAPEYPFLSDKEINSYRSVGGSTLEWTAHTFREEYKDDISETCLISANAWPHRILHDDFRPEEQHDLSFLPTGWNTVEGAELADHIRAWRYGQDRAGDSDQSQAAAETVVDLAINAGRSGDYDRVIVHLIEPHFPYAAAADDGDLADYQEVPWPYLNNGGDREIVWQDYLTELRSGLDAVETLLDNFDAETAVITADHGESFGEWSKSNFGHGTSRVNPVIRNVPLVEVDATDNHTHQPGELTKQEDTDPIENLRQLGYI